MGAIHDLLKDVPIPRMVPVRQIFDGSHLEDVPAAVRAEFARPAVAERIRPGMRIAITAGSRGIDNLAVIIREAASILKEKGAQPFVIPAMGSHGGSTAEGQLAVIHEYGVTEDFVGCPVIATMECKEIGRLDDGRPILINRLAAEADGIISLNRIKAHTAFRGRYESGVMKMLTIGLGCQPGAEVCHRQGILHLGPNVEKFAFGILRNAPVLLGVGIIENAYDQTAMIRVMTKEEIPEEEPKLLEIAKSRMACLKIPAVDVLIVDRIGKWGFLLLKHDFSTFDVMNRWGCEMPYEMAEDFPQEALKAQAVAARTYALRKMSAHSRLYDVVDTTADQVYCGTPAAGQACREAVTAAVEGMPPVMAA